MYGNPYRHSVERTNPVFVDDYPGPNVSFHDSRHPRHSFERTNPVSVDDYLGPNVSFNDSRHARHSFERTNPVFVDDYPVRNASFHDSRHPRHNFEKTNPGLVDDYRSPSVSFHDSHARYSLEKTNPNCVDDHPRVSFADSRHARLYGGGMKEPYGMNMDHNSHIPQPDYDPRYDHDYDERSSKHSNEKDDPSRKGNFTKAYDLIINMVTLALLAYDTFSEINSSIAFLSKEQTTKKADGWCSKPDVTKWMWLVAFAIGSLVSLEQVVAIINETIGDFFHKRCMKGYIILKEVTARGVAETLQCLVRIGFLLMCKCDYFEDNEIEDYVSKLFIRSTLAGILLSIVRCLQTEFIGYQLSTPDKEAHVRFDDCNCCGPTGDTSCYKSCLGWFISLCFPMSCCCLTCDRDAERCTTCSFSYCCMACDCVASSCECCPHIPCYTCGTCCSSSTAFEQRKTWVNRSRFFAGLSFCTNILLLIIRPFDVDIKKCPA